MRERTVESVLQKSIKAEGGWCLKFVSPGVRGVPDRLCLLPGGVVAFVETKAPGCRVDPDSLQNFWARELRRLGFAWFEVNTTAAARALATELGRESRRHTGAKPTAPGKEVRRG